jgi:hypothetical protein
MTDRLIEIGRCYGMEMNVGKFNVMRISRESSPVQIVVDTKQLENVRHFNYLSTIVTNDARCTSDIKFRDAMAQVAPNRKKTLFTSKLDLHLRKKPMKCCIWSTALNGAKTWTLRKVFQKYPKSFEM